MLFLPWYSKKQPLLGVDINSHAICVTVLTQDKTGFILKDYARTVLPSGISSQDTKHRVSLLQQTLAKLSVQVKHAALAVDHSAVLTKTLEVDASLTEEEILTHIHQRAGQYLNQPLLETLLDFECLGRSKSHPNLIVVRWLAAKTQAIADYIHILKQAGLITTIVDINSYALQRAADYCYGKSSPASLSPLLEQNIAVIYMSGESILVTISNGKTPQFTMCENNKVFATDNTEISKIISMFILRTLQLYYQSEAQKPVTLLCFCGNIPNPAIITAIQQQTQIAAELATPFNYLGRPKQLKRTAGLMRHKKEAHFPNRLSITDKNPSSSTRTHSPLDATHEFMLSVGLAMRVNSHHH